MADARQPIEEAGLLGGPPLWIAALALAGITGHLLLRFAAGTGPDLHLAEYPLYAALLLGGLPLVTGLAVALVRGGFRSDLLAGLAIATSALLGEYLAGTLVVLMLSGGQALEGYAVRRASSALAALARRAPSAAHRRQAGAVADVPLDAVAVGDALVILPHEICPAAEAVVLDGTLRKIDEFLHIGRRLRAVALQSAVGGMALSLAGMGVAAAGYLPPVAGAVFQEAIDVLAILNALRAAVPPRSLSDY